MSEHSRHQIIKRLQAELSRGAPFDLAMLKTFGVSPKLAARYAESGWLVRLGHGVYAYHTDTFDASGPLRLLQEQVAVLHIGGTIDMVLQESRHKVRMSVS